AFWTEEKKWWFVADCPYNNADTIELYSQSPPSHDKVIFCPAAFWASNSVNPNFKSVRTLGLQTSTDQMWFIRGKSRYFSNATTIRPPPTPSAISQLDDLTILINELIHLTYMNGHFACGSTSEQQIQQWMEKHDAMDKLRWSLEKDRLGIWLY
ncbi:unnamed protein product, partial [Rotaria sp. Silwood1]